MLVCDVECRLAGVFEGVHLELDIPGLDEPIGRKGAADSAAAE